MIAVICENPKGHIERLEKFKAMKYSIAYFRYLEIVELEGRYTTIDKQDWASIYYKKNKVIIFLLDKGYPTSMSKLNKALKLGKQVIAVYKGQRYDIPYYSYLHAGEEILHPALSDLKGAMKQDYQITVEERKARLDQENFELYPDTDIDEATYFCRTFASEYDVIVNYEDPRDIIRSYHSLKFYLDNAIPYSKEHLPKWVNVSYFDLKQMKEVEIQIDFEDPAPYSVGDLNLLEAIAYSGTIKI